MAVTTNEVVSLLSGAPAVVVGLALLALGLLECFIGYKVFRVQVGIICFLGGLGLGYLVTRQLTENWVIGLVVGVVLGILLCILSLVVFKLGVFLFVGLLVFGLVYGLSAARLPWALWLALGVGVLAGVVSVFVAKPLIILSTAFGGAGMAVQGVRTLLGEWGTATWVAVVGFFVILALAVAGAAFQFKDTRDKPLTPPARKGKPTPPAA